MRIGPVGPQRLDHGGQHQPLHIGARRVVRTQRMALGGVQCSLQQGAKNGGLHLTPIGLGGTQQAVDLAGRERQHVVGSSSPFEQLAVELQHWLCDGPIEAAAVHGGPEHAQHGGQRAGLVAVAPQQVQEAAFALVGAVVHHRQQAHVFGKHAEQAAGQKRSDRLGRVAGSFERFGQLSQLGCHQACDLGADAGGVERERVGPQQAQAVQHLGLGQISQADAVRTGIGERRVGGTGAGELGEQLDDVAHIHHDQKGRPAIGNSARVVLRLSVCQHHLGVKTGGKPAGAGVPGTAVDLLALPDKAAAPVAVDAALGDAAVGVREGDRPLEHVVTLSGGMGPLDAQQFT